MNHKKFLNRVKLVYLWFAYGELLSIMNRKKYLKAWRRGRTGTIRKDFALFVKSFE